MILYIVETIHRYIKINKYQKQLIIFNLLIAYNTQNVRKIYNNINAMNFSNYTLGEIIDWLIEIGGQDMKHYEFWFDEFRKGNYMPLTPKIKNKRNLGAKHITRICLKDENALLCFTRYFSNKDYTIRRNQKGQYYIVIMNVKEFEQGEWNSFLDYCKAIEQCQERG